VMIEYVQAVIMILGTLPLLFILLAKVGGFAGIKEVLVNQWHVSSQYLTVVPAISHPYGPGPWIILGLCLVVTIGWCSGHQSMVQRNLGARTLYDCKLGYVMGGIPKTVGGFLYMVPMIAAPIIFSRNGIFVEKADAAYGKLILSLIPRGMLGLFLAGLLSAGLSSIGSVLNSASAMFVKDFYERFIAKDKPEQHYFAAARITTLAIIVISLLMVPVVLKVYLIMWLEQTLIAMVLGPFVAVLLLGIFWRRINTRGGFWGFVIGSAFALFLQQGLGVKVFFFIGWWSFVLAFGVTVIISLLNKPPDSRHVDGLTWESDFAVKMDRITEERARENGTRVETIPARKKVPVLLSVRFWVTVIMLGQIVLLLYFG